MEISFTTILLSIALLILMLLPGFILRKLKLIYRVSISSMVNILMYVCQPALSFNSFVRISVNVDGTVLAGMGWMFALSFVVQLLAFVIAKLVFFRHKSPDKAKVYIFSAVFSNSGFIGIPFIKLLFPEGAVQDLAVLYAVIFVTVFNMLIWTLGVFILTGDIKAIRPHKAFINPPVIILAVALPLFFFPQINFFKFEGLGGVAEFLNYFAMMTTPLSMFIVGIRMAEIPFKELFSDVGSYIAGALKLLVVPVVCFFALFPLHYFGAFDNSYGKMLMTILLIMTALPPAASTIAFSEKYRADVYTGVKTFLVNTILSVGTLPVVLLLLNLC